MTFNLKLSDERGLQLKAIAEREGKTVVDVITDLIRAKIQDDIIPADLPGVTVKKRSNVLEISTAEFEGKVPAMETAALIDALRGPNYKETEADIRRKQKIAATVGTIGRLSGIKVERMASGMRLICPTTGKKYPLAFNVAEDLAEQVFREMEKRPED